MSADAGRFGPFHQFTLDELKPGTPGCVAVEDWAAEWVDRLALGDTYDELLDRLDGSPWTMPDGSSATVDLPVQTTDPVYKRLKAIVRKVRQECGV